mmetsp:Transcript_18092/g.21666  ORF Transcript_18092/g.21666 Transcript_18092/m.21666 type:complete len:171 (+) Transcript_18092:71-583(+)
MFNLLRVCIVPGQEVKESRNERRQRKREKVVKKVKHLEAWHLGQDPEGYVREEHGKRKKKRRFPAPPPPFRPKYVDRGAEMLSKYIRGQNKQGVDVDRDAAQSMLKDNFSMLTEVERSAAVDSVYSTPPPPHTFQGLKSHVERMQSVIQEVHGPRASRPKPPEWTSYKEG